MKNWAICRQKCAPHFRRWYLHHWQGADCFDGYDLDGEDEIVIDDYSYPESSIKVIRILTENSSS